MNTKKKGLTLVECLISILLLSMVVLSLLGAFYISKIGTHIARHRMTAMNAVKEMMEQEIKAGYLGGLVDGDYYVTAAGAAPLNTVIGGVTYRINPSPYPAAMLSTGGVLYKLIGFMIEWDEATFGSVSRTHRERIATYVAERS